MNWKSGVAIRFNIIRELVAARLFQENETWQRLFVLEQKMFW